MEDFDIIIGVHSIIKAIQNDLRPKGKIYATEEGYNKIKNQLTQKEKELLDVEFLTTHKLQERAQKFIEGQGFKYHRVPSQIFYQVEKKPFTTIEEVHNAVKNPNKRAKIFCLDQVTDVHNAAAILRTMSFYDMDYLIISNRGNFGFSPSFYRIASGAVEDMKVVNVKSLSRALTKLKERGVFLVGFSEHVKAEVERPSDAPLCLVLGSEDEGLSNAVWRTCDEVVALKAKGAIKSLNVSIAAAVIMEKFFGD